MSTVSTQITIKWNNTSTGGTSGTQGSYTFEESSSRTVYCGYRLISSTYGVDYGTATANYYVDGTLQQSASYGIASSYYDRYANTAWTVASATQCTATASGLNVTLSDGKGGTGTVLLKGTGSQWYQRDAQSSWVSGSVTLPSYASKTGYTKAGWYKGSTKVGAEGATYTPSSTSGVTLNGLYTANSYTISFNTNGGDQSYTSITKTYDTDTTIPSTYTPTKSGSTFGGWSINGNTLNAGDTITDAITGSTGSDVTMVAIWVADTKSLTFHYLSSSTSENSISISKTSLWADVENAIRLLETTATRDNCTFKLWDDTDNSYAKQDYNTTGQEVITITPKLADINANWDDIASETHYYAHWVTGSRYVWNGTSWVDYEMSVWDGSNWVKVPFGNMYVWDGTDWKSEQ